MKLTTIREIWKNRENYIDKEISIGGWVRSNRDSKAFGLLMISDGTYSTTTWQTSRSSRRSRSAQPW